MNIAMTAAVVAHEIRLRSRRLSSLVAVFAVVAASWLIVLDPANGHSMVVIEKTRAIYNSTALALGTSVIASFLLGLGGFYLVRGRTRDDLVNGVGAVLAATSVSNAAFVFARWLGAVAYLVMLVLAMAATMMVLQAVRGEAPLEPLVFLQMYAFMLLPTLLLAASVAVLCDNWRPLMGKGGVMLYFVLWIGQFSAMASLIGKHSDKLGSLAAIDISGLGTIVHRMREIFHSDQFSFGGGQFDASLPSIVLHDFWTWEMVAMRVTCMLVTILPLVPAMLLFHRYAPDRVKSFSVSRNSLWSILNRLLQPVTALIRPLFSIAMRTPGFAGQVLAEMALALKANPVALVAILILWLIGAGVNTSDLGGVLAAAMACWGILISDISVRDMQSATSALTAVVPGGTSRRYWRHLLATALLGFVCAAPVLLRWLEVNPMGTLALLTGVFALSAVANTLGRLSRTGRTFLALFLFYLYVATQVKSEPWFDVVGFNGLANTTTIVSVFLAGILAAAAGFVYNQRARN